MKVQITKDEDKSCWYYGKEGKIFEVKYELYHTMGSDYYMLANNTWNGIRSADCKVIKEKFVMLKSYQDQKSGESA